MPVETTDYKLSESRQGIRVLLVDDFSIVRLGMISALEDFTSVQVVADTETAEQAIERVKQGGIDVVIMDLGLPGINGVEATREIKAIDPSIKIIALTSRDTEQDVLKTLEAGANGYCLKTIPAEQLVRIIEDVYRGSMWVAPEVSAIAEKVFRKSYAGVMPGHGASFGFSRTEKALTSREREVLKLLVEGQTNSQIAQNLYVSVPTVKSLLGSIFIKLHVEDRVQAAVKAVREGFVS